ncbi:hypothetical protein HNY73_001947 [Argiope bruennichi]|uniref:Uncharacterized protein n=1 Tax=Argiope bruennichi TaxID=94029 RepID=A0A8T0FUQ1_ARGBR|nr:hypothetical protein HNY73_001947 [Argiope bruennichi]
MDNSNTSLKLKLSVELKKEANIDVTEIKNIQDNQVDFQESVKKSIFWKMHLKRKAGLEEMNQCVENLVKECLFWKKQLEGLTYQNWLLESEKRSLQADYEELLEKTKHDMASIESEIDTLNETVVNEKVIPKDDEPASDNLTAVEKNIFEEWRKNKISSVLIENENYHLLRHYEYLHKRMKDLNERYIEMADLRNMKEAELHRYMAKATDLYHTVTMKRKKFVIPPRDEREDLRIRIRTQMNENEALRKFLSLSFSYTNEDFQFQEEFTNDLKQFYTRLFHQEKTGTKSAVDSDEQTTPESVQSE